jgi:type VI secretion system protein ImpK
VKLDDPRSLHGVEPTLVMPAPGGQATVVMKRKPARAVPPRAALELQRMVAGINPLVGAASPLLALAAQLRRTPTHPDPAGLRRQLLDRIADFEAQAAAGGVARPKIGAARYLLCSFIDETVAHTPWGSAGPWAARNLLQEFHEERWGGEKAFQLLDRLGQAPEENADLLELFYLCLRLGFEGRYRGAPNGRSLLDALAARVLEVIRPADVTPPARQLSPQWQGVAAPSRRETSMLPPWAVVALAAALVLGVFFAFNARLESLSQPVFRQVVALPAALRTERRASPARPLLAPALKAEASGGALQVRDEPVRSVVTLAADSLFVRGSASVDERQLPLIARIAGSLAATPGQIAVIGHTDAAFTSSPQFPSAWHLSYARARAVQDALVHAGIGADRVRAEGRAGAEPLAAGNSEADRARNRRIEIELRLPRPMS